MKRFQIPALLTAVVLILAGFAFSANGLDSVRQGFVRGIQILIRELPLLAAAFLTAGLLQALIKKEFINKWLGKESGVRGILLASLGGGLIPGGPYAYYPIAGTLLKQGAGLGVLISFVTAKNLWSISRLPLEIAILGAAITSKRYLVTFLIPPLLGLIVDIFFGSTIQAIREGVE